MLNLVDGMVLYHGSYCEISSPDLDKCAPYKDFGKGFYLTTSYQQARKFIDTSLIAYIAGTYGDIGSQEADAFCISRLLPDRLENQYCFRTERSLECLEFMESEKVWKN